MESLVEDLPPLKTRPMDAIRSTIDSPNWGQNLLWLSIAVLLQSVFVGQIALLGWGSEVIERRSGLPGRPTHDVNPDRIGDYIQSGIWPFIVSFVVQIAVTVLMLIPMFFLVLAFLAASAAGEAAAGFAVAIMIPLAFLFSVALMTLTVPFVLNAMICQEFSKALDIGWARHFVSIMFWEVIVSGVVYYLLSLVVLLCGFLLLCVGYIPATAMVTGGAMHMLSQWYEIFLQRGGRPIEPAGGQIVDATII
ncbi:MAG: hypothetical protein Aurels2KO_29410 [Aureliella sp.]